jgi:hypothetical protein
MERRVKIGGFAEHAGQTIKQVKTTIITDLFQSVVRDTPVLTGALKANWRVSKDKANPDFQEVTADPSAQIANDVARLVDEGDQKIFLANGAPYGPQIEYHGHSPNKAPQGMVRLNIIRAANKLKTMKV